MRKDELLNSPKDYDDVNLENCEVIVEDPGGSRDVSNVSQSMLNQL